MRGVVETGDAEEAEEVKAQQAAAILATFDEALARQLKVMDSTAFSMCRDNDLPIIVFNFSDPDSLERILSGDTEAGTIVS